ncbi:thioredoxin-dependent thiol peroxidase [Candidatus Peregrinibacteria bacterium]|nr:MAG: thioredoxin-dependent thiol peroxidase [Candidatus Peregrinibacteria bacterium]
MTLENKPAPAFTLSDQNGKTHSLADYQGQWVLLYFYPKDLTPGCTVEACTFRDLASEFKKAGVQVLGVSADDVKSHKKFEETHELNFPLLADVNKKVVQDYGVWVEKSMVGKKYMGIQRDSFLINPKGVVIKHYQKVKTEDHPAQVLKDVKALA